MEQLIKNFPIHLKAALDIARTNIFTHHPHQITRVVLAGMGGSGISGQIVSNIVADLCSVPFIAIHSYHLPAYVDKHTLLIVASYSGNTEETINILEQAMQKNAKIVCMTSGGQISKIASERYLDILSLPEFIPYPRAGIAFSIVHILDILFQNGFTNKSPLEQIRTASDLISFEQDDIIAKAEKIAHLLQGKMPVIYTIDSIASVAVRWRQQFNENAKILCWHHTIPELNHNELVGWKEQDERIVVLFLRLRDEYKSNQTRIELTKQIISSRVHSTIDIYAKGFSLAEKMLYLIHLGDWISWFLAGINNVNPEEIKVIDFLKSEMRKNHFLP